MYIIFIVKKEFIRDYKSAFFPQIFDFILWNFVLFFWDFNGGSSKKEDLQIVLLNYEEKIMKNVRGGEYFYNDECARPPTH